MVRGILRILVVGLLFLGFMLPVQYFIKKSIVTHRLEQVERETIGSTGAVNPRVKEAQKVLSDLHFYVGAIDGAMGDKTRVALRSFQEDKGLPATGWVDPKTLAELNRQGFTAQKLEQQKTAGSLSQEAKPADRTENNVTVEAAVKDKQEIQDKIINSRAGSKERVREVQLALKKAGFYKGNIDGKLGIQTKNAIKEFQISKNLKPDGITGPKTYEELRKILNN
jgi:peptidoglycan hydrolase-like protein with peptidoglycan-binding domain